MTLASTHAAARALPDAVVADLRAQFDTRCSIALAVREQHGRDESALVAAPPQVVVFALNSAEVARTVALAAQHKVPVIPFGGGTSLEGQLLAVAGGISLDVSRMNQIVHVEADDMLAVVQPGVTRKQLNEAVRTFGLFFPVDPGAEATLGGMAATRASGTNAVRYGTMRENVLALEVVTPQGQVIRTGTRASKSSAGYDLTHLYIGSEGTLGVITELTVRLRPLPEAIACAICSFPDIEAAIHTTIDVIQHGLPIARVELLDANTVGMVNRHSHLALREEPLLLMEFHGSPQSVREQTATAQEIASGHDGSAFEWETTPEGRTRLWTARHQAFFAALQSKPGCRAIATDACVPISRLADCMLASIEDASASGIPFALVGHVGDGNFHFAYLVDPSQPQEQQRAEALNVRLVERALSLGGTCSGEHGIGLHKRDFLLAEAGEGAVDVMRRIKQALDPDDLLNPEKIFLPRLS
jgi:D-lactate dehydrogenase (cytochrome)